MEDQGTSMMLLLTMLGLPMLVHAEAGCPTVTPDLELNPPSVVVRYGDSVSVNCSTSSTDHDGMGWEATEGDPDFKEGVSVVTWTVENVRDWNTEPKCFINLPEGQQCTKTLPVTLYKSPDSVSVSRLNPTGPMVDGTEYQLSCDILNVAPVQNLTVTWYEGNESITTTSSDARSKIPVKTSSVLAIIPSKHDDGAQYRCEAHLHLGPDGPQPHPTVTSQPFILDVQYKPVIMCPSQFAVEEHRGTLSMVSFRADGNPAPRVQRYLKGKQADATTLLTRRDSGEYVLMATNDLGNANCTVDITVEYAPELSCPDHYDGEEGTIRGINLNCTVEGIPAPVVIWNKDGKEVEIPGYLTRKDRGGYIISAENTRGNTNRTVDVNIWYKPEIQCPSQFAVEEHRVSLSMVSFRADGNPAPQVQRYLKGKQADATKLLTRRDSGEYVLIATNDLGNANCTVDITVEYAPELSCPRHYDGEEGKMRGNKLNCTADGNPAPVVIWNKDGKEVEIPGYLTRKDRGGYIISAENTHGKTKRTVDVNIWYGPEFLPGSNAMEVAVDSDASLVCSAEGNPLPELSWSYPTAGNILMTAVTNISTEGRQRTINITGAISTNGGNYICTAKNKLGHGTRSTTVTIRDHSNSTVSVLIPVLVVLILILIISSVLWRKKQECQGVI